VGCLSISLGRLRGPFVFSGAAGGGFERGGGECAYGRRREGGMSGLFMDVLLFEEETFHINGAIFEVYREMGSGYLEAVYTECLEEELAAREIPFVRETHVRVSYKGHQLGQMYRPDFICYGKIIVEIKAVRTLAPEHEAQVLNYLKGTGMRLGILANFGSYPRAEVRRLIM